MPKISFTDLSVQRLKEGVYFDTKTPAFGLRVGKHRKTWIVLKGARSTKVSLGHYPDCSLQAARKKAHIALGTAHQSSSGPSFTDARDQFLEQREATLRSRSFYQLNRTLRRHFHWTKALDKLTHGDVSAAIEAIKAPSEAAHAFKDIRTFFNWCVPRHLVHSPCTGLKTPSKYVPRDRLLTEDEIKKIWVACKTLGDYGLQVRRLITTGQRANQIFSLIPEWIDGSKQVIVFPAWVMKGNLQHELPFGPLTAPLLRTFPTITNQGKFKAQLTKLCGFGDFTLHDFRRYYSSTHARLKTPIDITEALLSHVSGSRSPIQRVYDHYDRLEAKQEAVAKFEQHLLTFLPL